MKKILAAVAIGAITVTGGCSHRNSSAPSEDNAVSTEGTVAAVLPRASYIPRATVFKMSGAYADKVAVTLGADGNLTYYPAPGDVGKESAPVYLGGGWWLNRQGLGAGSVFTDWTFEEYSRLKDTPTPAQIKAHIIPGASVTAFRRTAVPQPDAMRELAKIKESLKDQ